MSQSDEWVLVRADALPEVFVKVLAVQEELIGAHCRSVSAAAQKHGISRSAYYKYRDAVARYIGDEKAASMTVDVLLQDCPGVLSGLLSAFAQAGANIVTVHQQLPENGRAAVSICARTETMTEPLDRFIHRLGKIPGVQQVCTIRRQGMADSKKGRNEI